MAGPRKKQSLSPIKKITSIYIATTIVAILLVGLCNYQYSLRTNIKDEKAHLLHISQHIKDKIEILLSKIQKDLELVASLPQFSALPRVDRMEIGHRGVPGNIEQEKRLILNKLFSQTNFSRAFILLPDGNQYLAQPYAVQQSIKQESYNQADQPYFQEIQGTTETVISQNLLEVDNKPAIVAMTPLMDSNQEIYGYLGGVCFLHNLNKLIKEAALKDLFQAFVVDSQGNLVFARNDYKQQEFGQKILKHCLNQWDRKSDEESACRNEEYNQEDDGDWLTSICRLDNGWGLIICESKEKIINQFLPSVWRTTLLTGFLFLIISAIGIFFVRSAGLKWLDSQKALTESRQRFKELVDLLPLLVCELDNKGYITYANRAALEYTGYEEQDLEKGYHILRLFAPEDRKRIQNNMALVYEGGESTANEYSIVDRNNNHIPVLVYSRPIIRNGVILGVRGVAADISKLKKTEDLLRRSEERFRLLYDNSPLPQQSLDNGGLILEINQAWLEIMGYTHQEAVGRSFTDFLDQGSKETFQVEFPALKEKGSCDRLELNLIKKEGSLILASFNGRVSYDEAGNFLKILHSFQDITEIRRIEEEKERYRRGLEKLENWIKELFSIGADLNKFYLTSCQALLDLMEADSALLPLIDQTGKTFTYVAAAGRKADFIKGLTLPLDNSTLCGWTAAHGETLRVADLRREPRADQEIVKKLEVKTGILTPIYSEGRIIGGLSAFRRHTPFEEIEEHLLNLFAHRVGALLANLNLLLRLEEMVEERTRELSLTHKQLLQAEKLSAIGSLSASIAHEFNNPLQGIMSIIKGVKQRASLEKEDVELVDMAIKESERMRDLISSLQEFNRPTSGKHELVDLHNTIDQMLLFSKKDHKSRGIEIETNYDKNLPRIRAVHDQIQQVILNLIKNAAEACSEGDRITISTKAGESWITISIADTGKGIAQEDIVHIFEPFFTTKPEFKGTGLGLAVSFGIIKAHHGDIEVESEPGKGTVFTLYLPRVRNDQENNAG